MKVVPVEESLGMVLCHDVTRIIPLVIHEERIRHAEEICRSAAPLREIRPLRSLKAGIVTT